MTCIFCKERIEHKYQMGNQITCGKEECKLKHQVIRRNARDIACRHILKKHHNQYIILYRRLVKEQLNKTAQEMTK
jgi:hypothetical protein